MNDFGRKLFEDCRSILDAMEPMEQNLFAAIIDDLEAKRRLKDAEEALKAAEGEIVVEAAVMAKVANEGAFANIAATSPAYKAAVDALLYRERSRRLSQHVANVSRLAIEADRAVAIREDTQGRLSALKSKANLISSMLSPSA